jgi:hypothetical protein
MGVPELGVGDGQPAHEPREVAVAPGPEHEMLIPLSNSPWLHRDVERIEQLLTARRAAAGERVGSGEEPCVDPVGG